MNIQGAYTKQVRRWIEKIRMPSGQCQSCLSDKSTDKDYMLTCKVCQSAIHNKHYGREINQPVPQLVENWKCERCRIITQTDIHNRPDQIERIQCQFCPSKRGILKRVIYNNNETIWLHPECWTWPYPIIFQKNRRQTHYNSEYPSKPTGCFWVNLQDQKEAPCQICNDASGYKIKCFYYTCKKYYHCSCAKSIGVVRDLESMHFQNSDTYIPPYCEEHLSLRVQDCSVKRKKYKALGDEGKASHFNQMMQAYQAQLKNMNKSAQKYKEEQEIRLQMQYQTGEKEDLIEELSFEQLSHSYHSIHNEDFINQIFDKDYPATPHKHKPLIFNHQSAAPQALIEPMIDESQQQQQINEIKEQRPPQPVQPVQPVPQTTMKPMIKLQRPKYKASPRQSDIEQSEWNSNQDLQDMDQQDD